MPVIEVEWLAAADPEPMLAIPRGSGDVGERKLRLFAAACCRRIWGLLGDERSRIAVEVAEEFADGRVDHATLRTAAAAAEEAYQRINLDVSEPGYPDADAGLSSEYAAYAAQEASASIWHSHDKPACYDKGIANEVALAAADSLGPDPQRQSFERLHQAELMRCIIGNPFRPVLSQFRAVRDCQSGVVSRLAQDAYDARHLPDGTFVPARLLLLADALEDAGCTDPDLLSHLRGPGPHVRGAGRWIWCWGRGEGFAVRRRKLLAVLAGLAVVVAGLAAVLWPALPSRIIQAKYSRPVTSRRKLTDIKLSADLTREQVTTVWGTPDAFRGSGCIYIVYFLDDDSELDLLFRDKKPNLLRCAIVMSRAGEVKETLFSGK
jgi:hypothetical protein